MFPLISVSSAERSLNSQKGLSRHVLLTSSKRALHECPSQHLKLILQVQRALLKSFFFLQIYYNQAEKDKRRLTSAGRRHGERFMDFTGEQISKDFRFIGQQVVW